MKSAINFDQFDVTFKCVNEMTDEWKVIITNKITERTAIEIDMIYTGPNAVETKVFVIDNTGLYNPASAYLFWPIIEEKIAQYFE